MYALYFVAAIYNHNTRLLDPDSPSLCFGQGTPDHGLNFNDGTYLNLFIQLIFTLNTTPK